MESVCDEESKGRRRRWGMDRRKWGKVGECEEMRYEAGAKLCGVFVPVVWVGWSGQSQDDNGCDRRTLLTMVCCVGAAALVAAFIVTALQNGEGWWGARDHGVGRTQREDGGRQDDAWGIQRRRWYMETKMEASSSDRAPWVTRSGPEIQKPVQGFRLDSRAHCALLWISGAASHSLSRLHFHLCHFKTVDCFEVASSNSRIYLASRRRRHNGTTLLSTKRSLPSRRDSTPSFRLYWSLVHPSVLSCSWSLQLHALR